MGFFKAARTAATMGRKPKGSDGIEVTGDKELDQLLTAIAKEDGLKSIKAQMRKVTRKVTRHYVLPAVKKYIPSDTNYLESTLKVRSLKRSRVRQGHMVTLGGEDLFRGDTFYGGFVEFGTKARYHKSGKYVGYVEEDSYLRRGLYENKAKALKEFQNHMFSWIVEVNKSKRTKRYKVAG